MAWIYLIKNKVNNKSYVGFTTYDPEFRFKQHQTQNSARLIHAAIKKYGVDSFDLITLYWGFDESYTLKVMEEHFIQEYNSHYKDGHGYNMSYGGTSNRRGMKATPEQCAQMSKSRTGLKRPDSGKAISAALKGRTITREWRDKLSSTNMGKIISEETKQKMRGERGPQKNPSSIKFTCIICKRELDARGSAGHFKSHN